MKPWVGIVLITYNHRTTVEEAIRSVWQQSYGNIRLWVIDNASSDGTAEIITKLQQEKHFEFIASEVNLGNCVAFNRGWRSMEAAFYIDLSGDDVLEPQRVALQVQEFERLGNSYGVVYSDGLYINQDSIVTGVVSESLKFRGPMPVGDVYESIIRWYFVAAPTMMIRRAVLEDLAGYDERLAYEDFDFWVRSSRHWKYGYLPVVTTRIRKSGTSLSAQAYRAGDRQLASTVEVCKKIRSLNRSATEDEALRQRLRYEVRHALAAQCFAEARDFLNLLHQLGQPAFIDYVFKLMWWCRFPWINIRRWWV